MRGHHGGGIHHGVAGRLRHVLFRRLDPVGGQAESRITGLHAVQAHVGMTGVDGQPHARIGLTGTHRHALQANAIVVRTQVELVAHVNRRRQETDFLGKLAAHTLDAHQQVTPVGLVHQLDQLVSHFQAQDVHRLHILPRGVAVASRSRHHFLGRCRGLLRRHRQLEGDIAQHGRQRQEGDVRHARDHTQNTHDERHQTQCTRQREQLAGNLLADVIVAVTHARDQQAGRHRDHQRRHLGHQCITDGQQHIVVGGGGQRQTVLHHPDDEATHQVDHQDQDARDGIAPHELRRTVHRAIEVGLAAHFLAATACLSLIDLAGVQIGIDGHLLARHGIQGKARRYLGNTPCALGDHHEVDHREDGEHDDAHRIIAADQEVGKRLDHLAGRIGTGVAVQQHGTGGGHAQRQPHQRRHQQHRRKHGEVQRLHGVHRHQQHQQRGRNIEGEQEVQHRCGQRQQHHGQHHHGQHRHRQRRQWRQRYLLPGNAQLGGQPQPAPSRCHALAAVRQWRAHACLPFSECFGSISVGTGRSTGACGAVERPGIQRLSW